MYLLKVHRQAGCLNMQVTVKCPLRFFVSVCGWTTGYVIVLGAEVLPVYHWAASFLPHIFQVLEDKEVSVKTSALCPLLVSVFRPVSPS